jgi:ring-1,2-phenylacetyl-CoA epoxidase subunit PaaE
VVGYIIATDLIESETYMDFYTLKVTQIIKETEDTTTICFKQPGLKRINYLPGQYLSLVFRINGRRYIRPYSFSSAPGIDATLNITVKRVSSGIISNHIIDKVRIGDMIEVMPPMGSFLVAWDELTDATPLVLWAAGSGITPLMSIVKFSLKNRKNPIILVYGNRDFENAIFADEIELLCQHHSNFTVWHFHSQAKISNINPYLIEGRITPTKVLTVLKGIEKLENSLHYICGPSGLKDSVKEALNNFGIHDEHIYSEDFEIVQNPKDFEDVITRSIEIIKEDVPCVVEVTKGKSILEAGLDFGIELQYSCQTGDCSMCKGKLLSGSVKTIGVNKIPTGVQEDEYLLCCTYPMSDDVKVEAY